MTRGERIIQLRAMKDWTRVDLSNKSGVGYDRLNKIETGNTRDPRGNTLEKIAKALGVSVTYLNTGEEASQAMIADELQEIQQDTEVNESSNLSKQAWKLAEEAEVAVYGKGNGDLDFMLRTYELIYKRLLKTNPAIN